MKCSTFCLHQERIQWKRWEVPCFDNIQFYPLAQRISIQSLTRYSHVCLYNISTLKDRFSKQGTSSTGQVCYLHYTMTCWHASSVSKCHISTFTWSLAVPTDIHQNLVQSGLWCVCSRWHFYWVNSRFGIWSKMVKRKCCLLYSYLSLWRGNMDLYSESVFRGKMVLFLLVF